ncbi:MAG: hypothetical protein H5T69_08495 [Chloroflexi bacterium]|nr:hypothetical protein [Chloroflexota bacterium]
MDALLPALLIAYLFVGGTLLLLSWRMPLPSWLRRGPSLLLALLSTALLTRVGRPPVAPIRWIPSLEPVALAHQPTAIYLIVLLCWSLCRALDPRPERSPPGRYGNLWPGLAYLSCAFVVATLAVDQFLARAALLDLLALWIVTVLALFALPSPFGRESLQNLLLLRLGDLALLALVLSIWHASGTLHIDSSIQSVAAAPASVQAPIALFALLAVAVKTGLPPFHAWVRAAMNLPSGIRSWVVEATLPLLGVYLLYRMRPILLSFDYPPMALVGAFYLVWGLVRLGRNGNRAAERHIAWFTIHGGLGFILAGSEAMSAYLLSFLPFRLILGIVLQAGRIDVALPVSAGLRGNLADPPPRRRSPRGRLAGALATVRAWGQRLTMLSEPDPFIVSLTWVSEGVLSLSAMVQRLHTGRLHRYLLWVIATLVGALFSAIWLTAGWS